MLLNVHRIANRCIQNLNPDISMVVIRCTGATSEHGVVTTTYGQCELLRAQKQPLNGDEQALVNNQLQDEICRKFYMAPKLGYVTAGRRDLEAGPSYLWDTATGEFYRVYNVNEDYFNVGWIMAFGSLQNNVPPEVEDALEDSGLVDTGGDDNDEGNDNEHDSDQDQTETDPPHKETGDTGSDSDQDSNTGGGDGASGPESGDRTDADGSADSSTGENQGSDTATSAL